MQISQDTFKNTYFEEHLPRAASVERFNALLEMYTAAKYLLDSSTTYLKRH